MRSLRSRIVMGLGLAAASVLPASRAMAGLSIDPSSSVNAYAGQIELVGTNATDNPSSVPYNKTTTANDQFAGVSSVQLNLTDNSFLTSFSATVADPFSYTSGNVQLVFTPTADLSYNLSGSHTETGASSFHSFSVDLTDLTTKTQLFDNLQDSYTVYGETLALGNQGGNEENTLSGSLTGTLLANHQYGLTIGSETDGMPTLFSDFPNPAELPPGWFNSLSVIPLTTSSSGSVTLGLSATTSAVPLPPAVWMGLVTLAAVGASLKLRRNAVIA
jgi:hypothetical protein